MTARDAMTQNPACCLPGTKLRDAAELMARHDCGGIPVLSDDTMQEMRPVGMITDRDIVTRAVAAGKNPASVTVGECMTAPALILRDDVDLNECARLLAEQGVRRAPVVDAQGDCCGILAQADIVRLLGAKAAGKFLSALSS